MASKTKRAAQQQRSGSPLKSFYWVLAVVGLAGIGIIAWTALRGKNAVSEPIQLPQEALSDPSKLVEAARGVKIGSDNAPVRLLVFSDFTCPACQQFTTAVEPPLRREYINNNQVQLVYYDFPLGGGGHQHGFIAARAARCAGDQNKFWEFHDKLFASQSDWAFERSPLQKFETYADEVGIDTRTFNGCVNSDKYADVVTANRALGEQLRVGGTPTLIMNSRHLTDEWKDYSLLKPRIQEALGTNTPAPSTTTAQ